MDAKISNRSTFDSDRMEIGEPGGSEDVMDSTDAGEIEVISLEDVGPTSSVEGGGIVAMDTITGDAEVPIQRSSINGDILNEIKMDPNENRVKDDETFQLGDLELRLDNQDDFGDESGDDVDIDDELAVGSTRRVRRSRMWSEGN